MLKLKPLRTYDYRYINKHLCSIHRSFKLLSNNEIIKVQSFDSDAHSLTKTTHIATYKIKISRLCLWLKFKHLYY